MKNIKMKDFFNSEFLISSNKGEKLFKLLNKELEKGTDITLDFEGVKSTITAFFFSGYGPLFKSYEKKELNKRIKFKNLNRGSLQQIETVEETSELFYVRGKNNGNNKWYFFI